MTSISQITRERLVVKGKCQSYPPMESIIKGMISYNLKWFCKTFSRGSVEKHLMMPSQNYNVFCNDIRLHMWLWFYRDCHLCPSTDRVYNVKSTKGKQNSNTKANLELRNVNKASQENRVSSFGLQRCSTFGQQRCCVGKYITPMLNTPTRYSLQIFKNCYYF